jgi:hypothetical protein
MYQSIKNCFINPSIKPESLTKDILPSIVFIKRTVYRMFYCHYSSLPLLSGEASRDHLHIERLLEIGGCGPWHTIRWNVCTHMGSHGKGCLPSQLFL